MARETVEYIIPTDLDDIPDGSTYKKIAATEATRLEGCDENAEVNPADLAALDSTASAKLAGIEAGADVNPTGLQIQSAITGLDDGDRVLVGSEPQTGEKKIYGVHINASGNIEADQDTVAES